MPKYSEEHKTVSLRLITYQRIEQFMTGPDKSMDGTITRICDSARVPMPKEQ